MHMDKKNEGICETERYQYHDRTLFNSSILGQDGIKVDTHKKKKKAKRGKYSFPQICYNPPTKAPQNKVV